MKNKYMIFHTPLANMVFPHEWSDSILFTFTLASLTIQGRQRWSISLQK